MVSLVNKEVFMNKEPINIETLDISVRLKNALRHSGITDLWELENLSKETILRIRNIGNSTFEELEKQCISHGVVIHSENELKDNNRGIRWSRSQCFELFQMGIRCLDDIRSYPMERIEEVKYSRPGIYGRLKAAKIILDKVL